MGMNMSFARVFSRRTGARLSRDRRATCIWGTQPAVERSGKAHGKGVTGPAEWVDYLIHRESVVDRETIVVLTLTLTLSSPISAKDVFGAWQPHPNVLLHTLWLQSADPSAV